MRGDGIERNVGQERRIDSCMAWERRNKLWHVNLSWSRLGVVAHKRMKEFMVQVISAVLRYLYLTKIEQGSCILMN